MSSLALFLITFACVFGGMLLGMGLRALLPEHHLSSESRDAVKLGTGMIATLAALVLGLLIASAKGTFDTMTSELRQAGSKIMLLDRVMAQYGPETREARDFLRRSVTSTLQRIWPEETDAGAVAKIPHGNDIEAHQDKLRQLSPHNDAQRGLQPQALQLRFLQVLTEVASEKNSTTIFPVPIDLLTPCAKMAEAFTDKAKKDADGAK